MVITDQKHTYTDLVGTLRYSKNTGINPTQGVKSLLMKEGCHFVKLVFGAQ